MLFACKQQHSVWSFSKAKEQNKIFRKINRLSEETRLLYIRSFNMARQLNCLLIYCRYFFSRAFCTNWRPSIKQYFQTYASETARVTPIYTSGSKCLVDIHMPLQFLKDAVLEFSKFYYLTRNEEKSTTTVLLYFSKMFDAIRNIRIWACVCIYIYIYIQFFPFAFDQSSICFKQSANVYTKLVVI